MGLESPQTYGEFYWKQSTEATLLIEEQFEKQLAPILQGLVDGLPMEAHLPPMVDSFVQAIIHPKSPGFFNTLARGSAEVYAGVMNRIFNHELKSFDQQANRYMQNTLLTPDIANILRLTRRISPEKWLDRQNAGGYAEKEAELIYKAQRSYPPLSDIIGYLRYGGDGFSSLDGLRAYYDIDDNEWPIWNWLNQIRPTFDQIQALYKRNIWNFERAKTELIHLGWQPNDCNELLDLSFSLPNPMLLTQGMLYQRKGTRDILTEISKADIHPDYAEVYLDGILTKPAPIDIIAYMLRFDFTLDNLDKELYKIGIHPDYFPIYKELAYPIPPVQDIITMAVREAFTPEIAARFGQYEGLPTEFVQWAAKKGISPEWSSRYWAAHWNLPSPQQGFEMLHRGVINYDDLHLLLRALDIMPFWREKLIQISFNPLTRVDIRRMYQLGVLSSDDVLIAYRQLGYNDQNAARLTQFTIQLIRQTLSKFTSADVTGAYIKRFINIEQARILLYQIGTKESEIENILIAASLKREWNFRTMRINAVKHQYTKGKINDAIAYNELISLGFPPEYVTTLIQQWEVVEKEKVPALWTTAQTLSFLKQELITPDRAKKEFVALGYDNEHINIYLNSVAKKTE
jgi:hypothetical protein